MWFEIALIFFLGIVAALSIRSLQANPTPVDASEVLSKTAAVAVEKGTEIAQQVTQEVLADVPKRINTRNS